MQILNNLKKKIFGAKPEKTELVLIKKKKNQGIDGRNAI